MKSKNLTKLLSLIIAVFGVFCFTACDFSGVSVIDIATKNGLDTATNESEYNKGSNNTNTTIYNTEINRENIQIDLYKTYTDLKNNEGFDGDFSAFLKQYFGENFDNGVDSSLEYVSNRALLSVVSIHAGFEAYYYGRLQSYSSAGSGVFYSIDKTTGDAYIITNFHVVYLYGCTTSNYISDNVVCYTYGSTNPISCTYVGGSMNYDIAILKVSGSEQLKADDSIASIIADSDDTTVGETVLAVGNPENEGISVTSGILCVDSEYISMPSSDNSEYVRYRVMRVDAAINSGNSGGGLFNDSGELIGIVNAKMADSTIDNIAYAIPTNIATRVADKIIKQCDGNSVTTIKKAYIGISFQTIESSAYYDGEKTQIIETLKIVEIEEGSLAENNLNIDTIINKIVLTLNPGTENEKTVEIATTRDFKVVDSSWLLEVGDKITFYTSNLDGTTSEPVTMTVTESALKDVK